jgi:UDP-N-acetylglucosamine diphosphorylase / glucose-1-phosphate thymidylyltransferase / UDP-N-acetylgalactosamine diphosphorylase / glucosamine-1-phosphate N-acetyltransferase / galactosamine-1-phosphate N-acetyltransferase
MSLLISDLLDLSQTDHSRIFNELQYCWEVLPHISGYLQKNLKPKILGKVSPHAVIEGDVFIDEGTVVEPHAYIKGPAWIGKNCEVRQSAYIRGNVIAGDHCVLGNSCEFKNCFLFNHVQVPHFSYVGDSVLGYRSHLGSGVTLSNLKLTPGHVSVLFGGKRIDTGLRKFGAVIGDYAEAGCHSMLNPGSIIGRHSLLYPGTIWRGVSPPDSLVKFKHEFHIAPHSKSVA